VRGELEAWNEKLARLAAHVCLGRARYAVRLAPPATTAYNRLTNRAEDLELVYLPKLNSVAENLDQREKNDWSIGDLEQEIQAEFAYIGQVEVRRGRPLTGPQLDDCEVRLARRDLRTYGSQGETRTAALSLILAQSEIVHEQRRVRPILFFDDIFSELDRKRAQKLREMTAEDHQVFIASAREDDVAGWQPQGLRKWEVAGGKMDEIDAETKA
jgi:DNA replication and repair protein RecF